MKPIQVRNADTGYRAKPRTEVARTQEPLSLVRGLLIFKDENGAVYFIYPLLFYSFSNSFLKTTPRLPSSRQIQHHQAFIQVDIYRHRHASVYMILLLTSISFVDGRRTRTHTNSRPRDLTEDVHVGNNDHPSSPTHTAPEQLP